MGGDTSAVKPLEFRRNSFSEEVSFQSRDVTAEHGGLIDSVQDTRDGWEEVGLKNLSVLKETEGVAGEVSDPSTDRDGAEFGDALCAYQRLKAELWQK